MAHFAKLDSENIVLEILAVDNEDTADSNGVEIEQIGIDFLEEVTGYPLWKQTSINSNFRNNYAKLGYKYDEGSDVFYDTVKPYDSWTFNDDTMEWEAPVDKPDYIEGVGTLWIELTKEWVQIDMSTNEEIE